MSRTTIRAHAMLALVMLLWAGNSIVGRAVRHDVPPFTLAFVRWVGALLILMPFAWRHVAADRAALLRSWKPVLLLGMTGVACFNAFLYAGLQSTTATNALLLQAGIPALVLVFDRLFFRIQARIAQIIGVVLSMIGVGAIVFRGDPAALLRLSFGAGDLLILAAVLVWSLYTSLLRLRPAVHPLSFMAGTFLIGAVAMLPFAAYEWQAAATAIPWRADVFGAFLYVAIFPSVIAYFLFNGAVAAIGAARAGQAISLLPLFGAVLAALLLNEPLESFHAAGMALIVAGIVVAAFAARDGKA